MKRLSNLLTALVFASLVIFMSCGGGDEPDPVDPLAEPIANLTVSGGFDSPTVTTDGGTPDGNWSSFTLSFTGTVAAKGGSFTTSVSSVGTDPEDFVDVWPASGTWTINDAGTQITRNDGVVMDVQTLTATSLTLRFDIDEPSARTSGIAGEWEFTF